MEMPKDLPFEEALAELEDIVGKLEGDPLPLEETVSLYQRGRTLAQRCQQMLDAVELEVQQLVCDDDGVTRVTAFQTEE